MGGWPKALAGLLKLAFQQIQRRSGAVTAIGTGLALADVINLDVLRQGAIAQLEPGAPASNVEELARTVYRMLGLAGDDVLWSTHSRGAQAGEPIVPRYFVLDIQRGRAWFSSKHYSKKSVNAAYRRGSRRGWSRGKGTGLRETQAYAKG